MTASPARILRAAKLLEKRFGRPRAWREASVLDTLVKTILSQNTTDKTSFPAFADLKRRYPKWEDVLRAPTASIAKTIRRAGLANTKARNIQGVLRDVRAHTGGNLSLEFLHGQTTGDARSFLLSLTGVGPKTAAVVLNFALRRPAFPVDTHVHRVVKRLGWVGRKTSREKTQEQLEAVVPDAQKQSLHINLITLGRTVCRPAVPHCSQCPLKTVCPKVDVEKRD